MVSFRYTALLALLASTVEAVSLRIGTAATSKSVSRELSEIKIAGYQPKTDVTDHVSRMSRCPLKKLSLASAKVLSLTFNMSLLLESYRQGSGGNSEYCEELGD